MIIDCCYSEVCVIFGERMDCQIFGIFNIGFCYCLVFFFYLVMKLGIVYIYLFVLESICMIDYGEKFFILNFYNFI